MSPILLPRHSWVKADCSRLAKFSQENRVGYLLLSVIVPGIVHGMFDWLLMVTDEIGALGQIIILVAFIALDIFMWIFGVRSIRKHRENSQFKNIQPNV